MNSFSELDLIEPLKRALQHEGYVTPTPIQAMSIPSLLAGRDLLACAQTGTGKTAAFALPTIQRLINDPRRPASRGTRALVLTPTRELAIQVEESFRAYSRFVKLRTAVIFGGVGQNPQVRALEAGLDVLVATPGRLLDLLGQGYLRLDGVEVFVLDEADRMLDMGFIHDVRRVLRVLPRERHSLFFSATMPPAIVELSRSILTNPVRVDVSPEQPTVEKIDQKVLFATRAEKPARLLSVLQDPEVERAIVFTRTKHGANKVVKQLAPDVEAEAIHGNKSQNARQRALENFKTGRIRVLVATDIAARGIDVEGISHVINYDLPNEPESYVHRIGRTARAGAEGRAISFCDGEERAYLAAIERLIARRIPVMSDDGRLGTPLPVRPRVAVERPERPVAAAHPMSPASTTPREPTGDEARRRRRRGGRGRSGGGGASGGAPRTGESGGSGGFSAPRPSAPRPSDHAPAAPSGAPRRRRGPNLPNA